MADSVPKLLGGEIGDPVEGASWAIVVFGFARAKAIVPWDSPGGGTPVALPAARRKLIESLWI